MACSKLFSGDLPELTVYIIRYLQNDLKSLYSCGLVNRLLCTIAIPILWEDPFSVKCQEGYTCNLLDTCIIPPGQDYNECTQAFAKELCLTILVHLKDFAPIYGIFCPLHSQAHYLELAKNRF